MKEREIRSLAKKLNQQFGLDHWTIKLGTAKRQAGLCDFSKQEFRYSKVIMSSWCEKAVRDTILHEIAHALVGHAAGHGPIWKAKAVEIGCKPQRCYTTPTNVKYSWRGVCPNGHTTFRHRKSNKALSCGKCSYTFDSKFLIQWYRI